MVVGVMSLIPTHYEICEVSEKTKEEHCASYQVAQFLGIKIPQFLDRMGGVLTALATVAIAAFTLTLKRATDRLWDAGERQLELLAATNAAQSRDMQDSIAVANKAAVASEKSAKVAEDALFIGQRPYIFVAEPTFKEPVTVNSFDPTGSPLWPWILVTTENHGKTPALITEVCLESLCVAALPDVPEYRENRISDELRTILGEGKSKTGTYLFKTEITGKVVNDILVGTSMESINGRNLYAFGYVKYDDIFGYVNTVGFCWRYNMSIARFLPEENEVYNYRKAELKTVGG